MKLAKLFLSYSSQSKLLKMNEKLYYSYVLHLFAYTLNILLIEPLGLQKLSCRYKFQSHYSYKALVFMIIQYAIHIIQKYMQWDRIMHI